MLIPKAFHKEEDAAAPACRSALETETWDSSRMWGLSPGSSAERVKELGIWELCVFYHDVLWFLPSLVSRVFPCLPLVPWWDSLSPVSCPLPTKYIPLE